jgi:hypothetical protein
MLVQVAAIRDHVRLDLVGQPVDFVMEGIQLARARGAGQGQNCDQCRNLMLQGKIPPGAHDALNEQNAWPVSVGGLRPAFHPIVFDKEAPRQRHQLTFRRMIDGFPADDARRDMGSMLVHVVAEIRLRFMRAGYQYFLDIGQRVAHLAEKLMLRAYLAAMLAGVVMVGLDLLNLHSARVIVQYLRVLMIDPHYGVQFRHDQSPTDAALAGDYSRDLRSPDPLAAAGGRDAPALFVWCAARERASAYTVVGIAARNVRLFPGFQHAQP